MLGERLIRDVVGYLEAADVPYFITGSIASAYYSEPRLTRDCDMVVNMSLSDASKFTQAMVRQGYYASEEAARDAVSRLTSFNVISAEEGFKVDVMVHDDDGYEGLRMKRRRRATLLDNLPVWISTPEDVILKKLEFYREGGSDKHLRDIASMLRISGDSIDRTYLEHWGARRGVLSQWRHVLAQVEGSGTGPTA
jgi:hypothetical protein